MTMTSNTSNDNQAKAPELILASGSPRRAALLQKRGISFQVIPSGAEESLPKQIPGRDAVMYLSLKKALWVEANHPELAGQIILAADTVVYTNRILGKPSGLEEARDMITEIRNGSHWVYTGVTLLTAGEPNRRCFCDGTQVFVKDFSDEELQAYINSSEPYDKAGGYAIQGAFGTYIHHIEGDYENVVGLPTNRVLEELERLTLSR